jgi:hypothetical protein
VAPLTSPLLQPVHSLSDLQQVLTEGGYAALQTPGSSGLDYLRLPIPETDLFLDIRPASDNLDERWEFYLAYPVNVPESRFANLTDVLVDFNRRLPWGSTGLAEDDTPYFRWSPTTALTAISGFRLLELVQMVLFFGRQLATQMAEMLLKFASLDPTMPTIPSTSSSASAPALG